MTKRFYVFSVDEVEQNDAPGGLRLVETVEGSVTEARKVVHSDAYKAGQYVILEDTSGLVTKSTKTTVTFEPTRKRPRKGAK